MVVQSFDQKTTRDLEAPKASDCNVTDMSSEVRLLPIPNGPPGSALGTLIDQTHKNLISRICFDERIFKTWFSGRVVLLGDGKSFSSILNPSIYCSLLTPFFFFFFWLTACRNLNPARTVREMTAIQDAVCLANWMNVLRSRDITAVEGVFHEYYEERYPASIVGCGKRRFFESINANVRIAFTHFSSSRV